LKLVLDRPASPGTQPEGTPVAARRSPWEIVIPAAVSLTVGALCVRAPGPWRDDAATMSAASRSISEMIVFLGNLDLVHGLHYLIVHVTMLAFGQNEFAARLPSVIAGGCAAAAMGALGGRLAGRRAGMYAGLLVAFLPIITRYQLEARSYELVMAVAIWVTFLFVRGRESGRFAAYGAGLVLLGLCNMFALLLIAAHGLTLLLDRPARPEGPSNRRPGLLADVRGWAFAVGGAAAVLAPFLWLANQQKGQISWIPVPGWGGIWKLARGLFGSVAPLTPDPLPLVALAVFALAVAGAVRNRALARLAVPWLLLPPVALVVLSYADPVYRFRYVLFCVPAAALLAGTALALLRRPRGIIALAVVAALSVPGHIANWQGRGRLENLRPMATVLREQARPGDSVIYISSLRREFAAVYPEVFARLRDPLLKTSPAEDGSLGGRQISGAEMAGRLRDVTTLWVVRMRVAPTSYAPVLAGFAAEDTQTLGFHLTGRWKCREVHLLRYQRSSAWS
jgi:mannosyltransferase